MTGPALRSPLPPLEVGAPPRFYSLSFLDPYDGDFPRPPFRAKPRPFPSVGIAEGETRCFEDLLSSRTFPPFVFLGLPPLLTLENYLVPPDGPVCSRI